MLDISHIIQYLGPLQWVAAVLFVPLVCWQFCANQTAICRWSAFFTGYGVQIGFFLLLDDVGFHTNLLVLISSVAAYFWITTTVALWPAKRSSSKPQKINSAAKDPEVTA
jgi:hypothetical protein